MATPTPQKVLVTGSANSSIKTFFTKLISLQTKHSFSICLALDLFSNISDDSIELAELLAGKIQVPLQVYVAIGGGILPKKVLDKFNKGEEICRNVTLLSKSGIIALASGLRIATFGGEYDPTKFDSEESSSSSSLASSSFTQSDVNSYISLLTPPPSKSSLPSPPIPSPDILITHSIPSSISLLSAKPLISTTVLSPPTDDIARLSRAKYHFIGGAEVFWEREPFNWTGGTGAGSCRTISLGELGNKAKERWFYAFSITPKAAALPNPTNSTPCPFNVRPTASGSSSGPRGVKRPAGSLDAGGVNEFGIPNFIFGGQSNDRKKGKNGAKGPPPDHYTCNICDQKKHWIQECPERVVRDGENPESKAGGPPPDNYTCKICDQKGHWIQECPEKVIRDGERTENKSAAASGGPPPDNYTCKICEQKGHWIQECPEKVTRDAERIDSRPIVGKVVKPISPDECWFCLSNPKVTKHLITSIGTEVYLTLPKGQIPPTGPNVDQSVSPVPGGGHVLIIPIAHYATLLSIPNEAATPILAEIESYKTALRAMYAEYGAKLVSFEVGRLSGKKGGHSHIQICPVPDKLAEQTEELFKSEGKKIGIEFEEGDEKVAINKAATSGDYFRVGLPNGKTLIHIMPPKTSFNLQFGRATMSLLLGLPERADWKVCSQDTAEEKRDCTQFKAAFKSYEPSDE